MITGEDVKKAMKEAGLSRIVVRDCSMCSYPLAYVVKGDDLYFDRGCWCGTKGVGPLAKISWNDPASMINMQSREEHRQELMIKFGFKKGPSE